MVGEEQQRSDAPTVIRTCKVDLGTYDPVAHFTNVTLPFKRVLAVTGINMPADTNFAVPIRVVSPNLLRFWAGVCATGNEMTAGPVGEAEIECVLPNE